MSKIKHDINFKELTTHFLDFSKKYACSHSCKQVENPGKGFVRF